MPAFETIADMAALRMDDKKRLRIAGEALFGSNWQSDLAAELHVADRTLQRWYTGVFEVPEDVWKNIADISRRRGDRLFKIADGM